MSEIDRGHTDPDIASGDITDEDFGASVPAPAPAEPVTMNDPDSAASGAE